MKTASGKKSMSPAQAAFRALKSKKKECLKRAFYRLFIWLSGCVSAAQSSRAVSFVIEQDKKVEAKGIFFHRSALRRMEELSANADNAARGKKLLWENILAFPGYETCLLTEKPDWRMDPCHNRTWQWLLNQLSFISFLMAYHRQSGKDEALSKAIELILSWWRYWKDDAPDDGFEFAWHDHGTALRAEQLVLFLAYIDKYASKWKNAQDLDELYAMLEFHGEMLNTEEFYSRNSNHGIDQARILLLLGSSMKGKACAQWRNTALRRLEAEYETAFTSEGVHKENSPAYHEQVLNIFIRLIDDYKEELGKLKDRISRALGKNLEFLAHAIRPDGLHPILGDTQGKAPKCLFTEKIGNLPEYGHYLYAQSKGRKGIKPDRNILFLPASGYAFVRDAWRDVADWNESFQLIVKGGALSHWHHHRDEGSILLYAFGEDWLIDSGLYNHNKKDRIRMYMRSEFAHNVPIIKKAIRKDWDGIYSGWSMSQRENNNIYQININLDLFIDIKINRQIDINLYTLSFNVKDSFYFLDGIEREVALNWHIPQDKNILINENIINIIGKNKKLHIISKDANRIEKISGDSVENISLISMLKNNIQDSTTLIPQYKIKNGSSIITEFKFLPL